MADGGEAARVEPRGGSGGAAVHPVGAQRGLLDLGSELARARCAATRKHLGPGLAGLQRWRATVVTLWACAVHPLHATATRRQCEWRRRLSSVFFLFVFAAGSRHADYLVLLLVRAQECALQSILQHGLMSSSNCDFLVHRVHRVSQRNRSSSCTPARRVRPRSAEQRRSRAPQCPVRLRSA